MLQPESAGRRVGAPRRLVGMTLVLLLAIGTWAYIAWLFEPAMERRSAGVSHLAGPDASDLYPRWRGTYAALWEGRDPYSAAVTADIQQGFYGRPLRAGDSDSDQQAFAYPLTIIWLFAPLTLLPFALVKTAFYGLAPLLIALSIAAWLRALQWQGSKGTWWAWLLLGASSMAAVDATLLQQPSILVTGLLAGAAASLTVGTPARGQARTAYYALAGVLLALATVKPQISTLLLVWLMGWALADFRRRWALPAGTVATAVLLLGSTWLLQPGWVGRWLTQVAAYQQYALDRTILEWVVPVGLIQPLLAAAGLGLAVMAWRTRRAEPGDLGWRWMLGAICLYTVFIFPSWTAYNQLILAPTVILLIQERHWFRTRGIIGRETVGIIMGLLIWPLIAATVLVSLWFIVIHLGGRPPDTLDRIVSLPWVTNLLLPLALCLPLAWLARRSAA